MYVCLCHAVTEHEVLEEAAAGASTLDELSARLGVATGCGCCREHAESLLRSKTQHVTGAVLQADNPINAYAV
ncbi:MAG: (2Fe-2S)-binding protein [Pseudomonadota bacterium]